MRHFSPDPEHVLALAAGEITGDEAISLSMLIEADEASLSLFRFYQSTSDTVRTDDSISPPLAARSRAIDIMPAVAPPSLLERWFDVSRTFIASRSFDSRTPAIGYRSGASQASVQFAYEFKDVIIDVLCERCDDGTWNVMGQATDDLGRACVLDVETEEMTSSVLVEAGGAFQFTLPSGAYDILLEYGDEIVRLQDVALENV